MRNKDKVITREIPTSLAKTPLRRCEGFAERCLFIGKLPDQDFIESLIVSCYTRGMDDVLQMQAQRREGTYEEER